MPTFARPVHSRRPANRHKVLAFLAAGTVVGVGATVTLAAWNDAEWINGSIGTETFEVQQNVTAPWVGTAWTDAETAPGNRLAFTPGSLDLTPSEAVYAPVSLTTTADSVEASSLSLAAATSTGTASSDATGLLFSALTLRVVVVPTAAADAPLACNAAAFAAASQYVVGSFGSSAPLATKGSMSPGLAAAGADKLDYCFEIALPANASDVLQGRQVTPQWTFLAESTEN
jgi:predicted ribosomally synthesized peptide with SipW-like signal peptide